MNRIAAACAAGWLLLLAGVPAQAATQRLSLRAGWNLVSLAVAPNDPSVREVLAPLVAGNDLEAIWGYDAHNGTWSRFPAAAPGAPALTTLRAGRGYWLKVKRTVNLDVEGEIGTASGPDELAPGWNLVGFPLEQATLYERVVTNASIRQIWTFDAAQAKFVGVVLDPQGTVLREDFVNLEAGRGYWLFSNQAVSLAPVLGTGLPPDLDVPPLVGGGSGDLAPKPFTRSAGDVDVAGDGFYDRTASQRAIDFGERLEIQPISIFNDRSGVLNWKIEVVDPAATPWLHFRTVDPDTSMQTLVTELSGSVASETDVVDIVVDRTGLVPGELTGAVLLSTNAADLPPPSEAQRRIGVRMSVAELDGDYLLTAEIKTVDGQAADLADPKLAISLYRDGDGVKVVVNESATLLISSHLRLSGNFVQTDSTLFEVSGSYEMPANDPGNPFGVAVRRDVTLRGQRRDPLDKSTATLGPLDLQGEYFETMRNVTAEPIFLAGTFVAERLGATATARDQVDGENKTAGNIPDNGVLTRTIQITDKVLITELDAVVEMQHPRPEDLVVTLTAPDATEAVLRSRSTAGVGKVTYDEDATPVDSLEVFNGKLSPGTYTLRVADQQAGQTGSLLDFKLRLRGTQVHDLGGTIAGVPSGTQLLLSGCGVSAITTTGAGGSFKFKNLVDCVYQITVLQSGFQTTRRVVALAGGDIGNLQITPPVGAPFVPEPVIPPSAANVSFVSLTTGAGAGAVLPFHELESVFDATTFDVDRPSPLFPDRVDTNAFLNVVDPLTGSNAVGINGLVDGPVGANARRITVSIGAPVIGFSAQGNFRLSAGGNP